MAKALTKNQIVAGIADAAGITKKQSAAALDALAKLAYKNAKAGFTVPGARQTRAMNRKAKWALPGTGETIRIPAKRAREVPRRQSLQGRDPGLRLADRKQSRRFTDFKSRPDACEQSEPHSSGIQISSALHLLRGLD